MSNRYANRTVSAGELILLNAGEYEDVYVAGLFRAVVDIDFNEAAERYCESIKVGSAEFDPPQLPPVAFGRDPRTNDAVERGFIAWLGERGMVERMPTVDVGLSGGFGRIGQGEETPQLHVQVDGAELEAEDSPGFGR